MRTERWNRCIDKYRGPTVTIYENDLDDLEEEIKQLKASLEAARRVSKIHDEMMNNPIFED